MWQLAGKTITSRFLLGTAQYPTLEIMQKSITAAQTNVLTVSLKRETSLAQQKNYFFDAIKSTHCHLLPNTAGCKTADEAIMTAQMAREIFATNWIKLEVIGDDYTLQPDPFGLLTATKKLIELGFEVFPYCTDDLVLCQRLIDLGCNILMPWAAPIGSGKGLLNPYALEMLRQRFPNTTLIIDAGIGKPSHATQAMEMGYDAVLLNTAVSLANDPILMANAFSHAITAGRQAYEAGVMPERNMAHASTSLLDTPFWHQPSPVT